jgi:ABC-type cobalt transport system substrate-binding protein
MRTAVNTPLTGIVLALTLVAAPAAMADDTVVGGAETAGERIKEAGRAAEPEAKSAWTKTKEGAVSFGHGVKNFFTHLFD